MAKEENTSLPYEFDLLYDIKKLDDLLKFYRDLTEDKITIEKHIITIEKLCRINNIDLTGTKET